jgi:hypothetical protein
VATYFCATTYLGVFGHPPKYNYSGYLCTDGTVSQLDVVQALDSQLSSLCGDPGPVGSPCTNQSCCVAYPGLAAPAAAKARVAGKPQSPLASITAAGPIYERDVPNPANRLSMPDEPVSAVPVVGEYTADFTSRKKKVRVRLVLFACLINPKLIGAAFLLDPASPPSPMWNPHFSEADGWVSVQTTAAGLTKVVIPGLPDFCLVR